MNPDRCPLCGFAPVEYRTGDTIRTKCQNIGCGLPVELWPAVQQLKDRIKELEEDIRVRDLVDGFPTPNEAKAEMEITRLKAELAAVKDRLLSLANRYVTTNDEPGDLASTWGWRTIAAHLRIAASEITTDRKETE